MTDVQSTIQDLSVYVKVKRKNSTWFLLVTMDTTCMQIKRIMKQFVNLKIHDMQLTIPRHGNRKFHDTHTLEQFSLQNGETLNLHLRIPNSDEFESVEDVTGNYDTITQSMYR